MKLMFFLNRQSQQPADEFRHVLMEFLQSLPAAITSIRLALVDDAVAPAQSLAMLSTSHPHDAVVSIQALEVPDAESVLAGLYPLAAGLCAYQVEEREPLHYDAPLGRVEGMCQVAMFKRPQHLTHEQWLDIWLNSHTQVAMATQSTFSYRQNIVMALLASASAGTEHGPVYDAIVEEQFPAAAMTDRAVFFGARGDAALYRANEKAMVESVMRFVDFSAFECVPMSEFRVR